MSTSNTGWIATFDVNRVITYRLILANHRWGAMKVALGLSGRLLELRPAKANGADGLLTERLAPYAIRA